MTLSIMRRPGFAFVLFLLPLCARQPVHAGNGMVVAMEPIAADVRFSVLKSGDAIDAAIAVGFALSVTISMGY